MQSNQTTIKFDQEEIEVLLDTLFGDLDVLGDDEAKERLRRRLERAQDRL